MAKAKQTKPGPKPRPPNLNDFIRKKALHAKAPTSEDLQALLVSLLYDTPEDAAVSPVVPRGKLKLDIIMALHKINTDKQPVEDSVDNELLKLLASRQQRRKANAGKAEGTGEEGGDGEA